MDSEQELRGVAVIGMSGRFPGARDVEAFWENICNGVESIRFFTDKELLEAGVSPEQLEDPAYVKAGTFLEGADRFDADFFRFNPREAEILDPQHRVFLEAAWEAMENAGYDAKRVPGPVSVFAGGGFDRYLIYNVVPQLDRIAQQIGTHPVLIGNDKDFLALRVAYKLDLNGAAVNVQAACSTSLVAVHLACQSLLMGECDMALAGGVTVAVPTVEGYVRQQGMTSADGHVRAFDADATGTVFGSGTGIVVLKRVEDAVADGDTIYAVIRGSALNNDGSNKVSFTAPSVEGQSAAISEALMVAGVEPETVEYVEAHGTGTLLGDPIEMTALSEVYGEGIEEKQFCAIGSVKNNVGHLDTASGVTGLIKTALSLHHKTLVPTINYSRPNPKIDFANSPFYVNTELKEWVPRGASRRAALSSFGFGGTNAHVVLEEAPVREASGPSRDRQLLVWSAKTETALEAATDRLAAHLKRNPEQSLADAAYTLKVGRQPFEFRRVLVCEGAEDAVQALEARDRKRVFSGYCKQESSDRPVVFLFSGTGSQYVNMAKELYETETLFQETVDACCELLKPHLGLDLRDVIYPAEEAGAAAVERLNRTEYAQPALFVIEYALSRLLMEWGVRPQAMIGHSLGEYVAACLAGVFSPEEALVLVTKRAQLIQSLPEGAMLAVNLPEAELAEQLPADVSLAVVNGEAQCVAAGEPASIAALQAELEARGVSCARVHTVSAFHSHLVEPIVEEFAELVRSFRPRPPELPFVSNVTGTWIADEEATDPAYWARHLRRTVRFADGVRVVAEDPETVLVEVGPGKTLSSFARGVKREDGVPRQVLTTVRHVKEEQSDAAFLLNALGRLWMLGVKVDWPKFYAEEVRYRVPLPTYPFERQRYWMEAPKAGSKRFREAAVQEEFSAAAAQVAAASVHARPQLTTPFAEPGNETEALIAEFWRELLGVEAVGAHDSFFDLGGNSLLATKLVTRLSSEFEVDVPLRLLFEENTVEDLALAIEELLIEEILNS